MSDRELESLADHHLRQADELRAELDARRLRACEGPLWETLHVATTTS